MSEEDRTSIKKDIEKELENIDLGFLIETDMQKQARISLNRLVIKDGDETIDATKSIKSILSRDGESISHEMSFDPCKAQIQKTNSDSSLGGCEKDPLSGQISLGATHTITQKNLDGKTHLTLHE